MAPIETIKTKCIERNMTFITGVKNILASEGIKGIYQGAGATALKQGSNQGLRFMWFNEYKKYVTNNGETKMTSAMNFLGGMSAGCFSTLGNNPFGKCDYLVVPDPVSCFLSLLLLHIIQFNLSLIST